MKSKDKKKNANSPFADLEKFRGKIAEAEEAKSAPKGKPTSGAVATPSHAKPKKPEKVSSHEEEMSFHRLMSGVAPLTGTPNRVRSEVDAGFTTPTSHTHAALREKTRQGDEDALDQLRALVAGGAKFEVSDDGAHVEGRRHDTRADLVRKLRHGQFPIDAKLDLHGMHASEAKDALTEFLSKSRVRKERCVLVICGQGLHSAGGGGVLRGEISAWLSQGPASHAVAAFASATRDDGGSGAVYVLLLP